MGSHILQILSINQPMRTEVRCGKWPAGRQNICAFCHSVHTEWQDAHIWVFASQNEDAWSLQCLFLEQGCLIIAILSANSPKRWGRFCGKQRAKIRDATYLDHHPKSNTPHSHSTIQYISYDLSESRNLQVNCANFHAPPPNIKKKKRTPATSSHTQSHLSHSTSTTPSSPYTTTSTQDFHRCAYKGLQSPNAPPPLLLCKVLCTLYNCAHRWAPNILQPVSTGMAFNEALSNAQSQSSRVSLLTGSVKRELRELSNELWKMPFQVGLLLRVREILSRVHLTCVYKLRK